MGCCSSKQQQQRGRRPGGRGPAGREPARARRQGAGRPEPGARAVENPQFGGAKAAEPEDGELRQRAVRAEERAKHAEGRANQANFQVEHAEVRAEQAEEESKVRWAGANETSACREGWGILWVQRVVPLVGELQRVRCSSCRLLRICSLVLPDLRSWRHVNPERVGAETKEEDRGAGE